MQSSELVIYPPIFAIWKWNFEVKPAFRKNKRGELQPEPEQEVVHV